MLVNSDVLEEGFCLVNLLVRTSGISAQAEASVPFQ